MTEKTAANTDGVNPTLWRLKQEAESEVKRLCTELTRTRDELLRVEDVKAQIARLRSVTGTEKEREKLGWQLPTDLELAKLNATKPELEAALTKAEHRLETELAAIRQAETASVPKNKRTTGRSEQAELLEAAARVLPEYTDKLDRIVQSVLTIWDRREKRAISTNMDVAAVVPRDLDAFLQAALFRLGDEFIGISEPLRQWINKVSAVHEEGRITDIQRMELRLRLTELEIKFQTAGRLLKQLNALRST